MLQGYKASRTPSLLITHLSSLATSGLRLSIPGQEHSLSCPSLFPIQGHRSPTGPPLKTQIRWEQKRTTPSVMLGVVGTPKPRMANRCDWVIQYTIRSEPCQVLLLGFCRFAWSAPCALSSRQTASAFASCSSRTGSSSVNLGAATHRQRPSCRSLRQAFHM